MDSFSRASSTEEDGITLSIVVCGVLKLPIGAVKW
jgi:hypothetical protein